MCLFKTHIFPRFSFKNKTVYKVIRAEDVNQRIVYYTPHQGKEVAIGTTILAANQSWFNTIFKHHIIDEGVHAYINLSNAISGTNLLYSTSRYVKYKHIVVESIIPKYTLYWIGDAGDIAATKMLLNGIMDC